MSSRDEFRNWRSSKERRFHHESRTSERRRPLEVRKRSRQRSIERRRPNEDRRHRNSSSSSHSTAEYRSGRRRRNRSSYDYYSGDDRRKRRRRRRSTDKRRSSSRRRAPSDHSPQRHRRRDYDDSHYRRRRRHSVGSSSPEARRRRRRRRRRRPRRRDASDSSPRPPPVAADVPPRAGVVSDDDDGAIVPAQYGATKTQTVQPTSGTARKGSSPSSGHDDTIGHFKGREGTVIADRYKIMGEVGVGTFGRVVECLDLKHSRSNRRDRQDKVVAIKIVRNIKRYYESALIEADIVEDVNRRGGRGVSHCAVMYNAFSFSGHYCMVFESLGPSLYDFLKRQNYQPFPSVCVREFAKQLLETLEFLHSFRLIHTDLKPENVLLVNAREVPYKGRSIPESTRIKVIDFGGATYDDEKKSSVVNTRQYRAPEVILGVGWSMPSDLWSVGKYMIIGQISET